MADLRYGDPSLWRTRISSCEVEYMALAEATKEALHLRHLTDSLGMPQSNPTTVFCDNQGALALGGTTY